MVGKIEYEETAKSWEKWKTFFKSFKIISHTVKSKDKYWEAEREGEGEREAEEGQGGRQGGKRGGKSRKREGKKEAKLSKFVRIICKKVKFIFKSVHIFGHVIEDREVSKSCSRRQRSNTG